MRLGDLEKLVLNFFWSNTEADAKQTHDYFAQQRGGSLNTIQSTLDRLYKKGLLKRVKRGHAFIYSASCSKKAFLSRLVLNVTEDFIQPGEDNLMAAFVNLSADLDENQLADLEATIRDYEVRHKQPNKRDEA